MISMYDNREQSREGELDVVCVLNTMMGVEKELHSIQITCKMGKMGLAGG
jgi:hypothetical protein